MLLFFVAPPQPTFSGSGSTRRIRGIAEKANEWAAVVEPGKLRSVVRAVSIFDRHGLPVDETEA